MVYIARKRGAEGVFDLPAKHKFIVIDRCVSSIVLERESLEIWSYYYVLLLVERLCDSRRTEVAVYVSLVSRPGLLVIRPAGQCLVWLW